ncbi:unnamed protein product [Trichogramma brassicae]|uniref:Uncharacterized protein n=1 Tax=Trichogramma brassicae TaxID=86971 RepID=A0A6H5J579_9HYME|nr:unnamed protein product [Trichogramma brassicae]
MSSEGPIDTLGTTTTTMMIGLCCSGGWRCIKLASDARSHIQTRMLAGGREREREKKKKKTKYTSTCRCDDLFGLLQQSAIASRIAHAARERQRGEKEILCVLHSAWVEDGLETVSIKMTFGLRIHPIYSREAIVVSITRVKVLFKKSRFLSVNSEQHELKNQSFVSMPALTFAARAQRVSLVRGRASKTTNTYSVYIYPCVRYATSIMANAHPNTRIAKHADIKLNLIYCGADDTLDDFVYLDDPKRRAEASYVYTHYDSSLRTHRNSQLYLAVILAWTMIVSTAPLQLVVICTSHMWR